MTDPGQFAYERFAAVLSARGVAGVPDWTGLDAHTQAAFAALEAEPLPDPELLGLLRFLFNHLHVCECVPAEQMALLQRRLRQLEAAFNLPPSRTRA